MIISHPHTHNEYHGYAQMLKRPILYSLNHNQITKNPTYQLQLDVNRAVDCIWGSFIHSVYISEAKNVLNVKNP